MGKCLHHEHCLDTHGVLFSKQVLRMWTAFVSQVRVNVHETMGRKNSCKCLFNLLHSK